ncbi:putative reverse transcriptase domain-containing protein [Tanacetum coccineum]
MSCSYLRRENIDINTGTFFPIFSVGLAGAAGPDGVGAAGPAGVGAVGPAGAVAGGNVAPEVRWCRALTWWNGYVQTMGIDAAYLTPWTKLKEIMTAEYRLRNEIQKMEQELWNLTVKRDDISRYVDHFHELVVMCPSMVTPKWFAPKLQEEIMETRGNERIIKVVTITTAPTTTTINGIEGHQSKDCRSKTSANGRNTPPVVTCYGCGENWHYKNKCPKRKDQQTKGARGRAYMMRNGEP